ncbi:MAG: transketolase C-terminal domain-containing protein, partial [bacterium]
MRRVGDDVTIVAFGGSTPKALAAAEALAAEGASAEVVELGREVGEVRGVHDAASPSTGRREINRRRSDGVRQRGAPGPWGLSPGRGPRAAPAASSRRRRGAGTPAPHSPRA